MQRGSLETVCCMSVRAEVMLILLFVSHLESCRHCETATGDNDGVPHLLTSYDRVQVD